LDIVIEAAIEDITLKQKIFSELEQKCSPKCILASNTSTISLELIGEKTKALPRIIGTHFFAPAHVMELLEIVRCPKTSPQVIVDTLGLASVLRKIPIVVGNCTGFTVNRAFAPYCQAACFLVERGVDLYHIDKVMESFGFLQGPFKMMDLSGLDVFEYVGKIVAGAYKDRFYKSTLGGKLTKANLLGQKTNAGFYKYDGRKSTPQPQIINKFVEEARLDAGSPQPIAVTDDDIVQMILYSVVNESCRVIEEGMVIRASDIDIGTVYGYGFPPHKGGIMKWAEMEGFTKVAVKLELFFKKSNLPLFQPCQYLKKLASK